MSKKPNILILMTDQLSWKALPAYGNKYCKTPNIDRIAENGVRFDKCYTTYPLCQPARASFWTGLFPCQTGVLSNGRKHYVPDVPESIPTLGELFSEAGYNAVHFGKKHDAGSLRGFKCEPENEIPVEGTDAWPVAKGCRLDRYTTTKVIEFLKEHDEQPFLAVADLLNPHDICNWVGVNKGEHTDIPVDVELPPLPDNFEFEDIENRPLPVQYICCSHRRQAQAAGWNASNYQHYLAAYYHYISRVDAEIGLILDALKESGDSDNTMIVLMADHGDSMASRGMVTKQVNLYDEITRIPFIFSGPGIKGEGRMLSEPLVSLIDLLPTLCDYAGVNIPGGLLGKSLVPLLTGERTDSLHSYVASEWLTEWGYTLEPGRMIRTQRYKYIRYLEGDGEELYDLENDPGEKHSLINDSEYANVLEEHRTLLNNHLIETGDPFLSLSWKADERWRSHKPGYHNHEGPAAPMV